MSSIFDSIGSLFNPVAKLLGGDFDPNEPVQTSLKPYDPTKHPAASPVQRNPNLYGSAKAEPLLQKWDKQQAKLDAYQADYDATIAKYGHGNAKNDPGGGMGRINDKYGVDYKHSVRMAIGQTEQQLLENLWYAPGYDPANPSASVNPGGGGITQNPFPTGGGGSTTKVKKTPKAKPNAAQPSAPAMEIISGIAQTGTVSEGNKQGHTRRGRVNTLLGGGELGGSSEYLGA